MNEQKKCFIVMPITTPSNMIDSYSSDINHFKHVLDHLFIPAIENAGFIPIKPVAKGAELIHAEIIKNIETADYLLCDMSILNPNVFFELGIRTALNKPISLVRDELTKNVPFDTHMINNYEYDSKMNAWSLKNDIANLSNHIKDCFDESIVNNSLWEYFSITTSPVNNKTTHTNDNVYIIKQLDALRTEIKEQAFNNQSTSLDYWVNESKSPANIKKVGNFINNNKKYLNDISVFQMEAELMAKSEGFKIKKFELIPPDSITVVISSYIDNNYIDNSDMHNIMQDRIQNLSKMYGVNATLIID